MGQGRTKQFSNPRNEGLEQRAVRNNMNNLPTGTERAVVADIIERQRDGVAEYGGDVASNPAPKIAIRRSVLGRRGAA